MAATSENGGQAAETREAPGWMPEFRTHQRARLILDYHENGHLEHCAQTGWAKLDGVWLHWFDDEFDHWQTWPVANIVCIDWERVPDGR